MASGKRCELALLVGEPGRSKVQAHGDELARGHGLGGDRQHDGRADPYQSYVRSVWQLLRTARDCHGGARQEPDASVTSGRIREKGNQLGASAFYPSQALDLQGGVAIEIRHLQG